MNQILPLFTIPFLSRILGVESYGVLALCVSISALAAVMTDFGFDLWATSEVAKRREDTNYVGELISAIAFIKATLFLMALVVIVLFSQLSHKYVAYSREIVLSAWPLLALTYTPTWLFQGIERMELIAIPTLVTKLMYMVALFSFVHTADDLWLIISLMGLTQALVAVAGFAGIYRFGYTPRIPSLRFVRNTVAQAASFFWSRAAVATYTSGGAVFVGLFSSSYQLGLYSTAEQLYRGLQSLAAPLSQAIYPKMVREKDFSFLYRVVAIVGVLSLIGALIGITLSKLIVGIIFGPKFLEAAGILNMFFLTLVLSTAGSLLGYPLFGALNRLGLANRSVLIAALIQLVFLFLLYELHLVSAFRVAVSVLGVELAVLVVRAYWAVKYGPAIKFR